MGRVHVIAVLGETPAVLTELGWGLAQGGDQVVGVDVWTTARGRMVLLDSLGLFDRARGVLGGGWLPVRGVPELGQRAAAPGLPFGFGVYGIPEGDLATPEQCAAFSNALHDRVRQLHDDRFAPLVGSLAGGRKTMSAALQSAFFLHARGGDRLVHVMLHAGLENELRREGRLGAYDFPNAPLYGVAPEHQVLLVDVPFARLRDVVEVHDPALARRLQRDHHGDLWQILPRATELWGHLDGKAATLILEMRAGEARLGSIVLSKESALVFAQLAIRGRLPFEAIARIHGAGRARLPDAQLTRDLIGRLVSSMIRKLSGEGKAAVLRGFAPVEDDAHGLSLRHRVTVGPGAQRYCDERLAGVRISGPDV